ncbi:Glycosyl hydrolases family 28 [Flavobacterium flevense]|uniref:Uncharacterized protein n=1 Tax=Flavobacterium flevense TaxID=983 RepID=A0A4Y4AWE0_9FLAO|nr:glycosyl hydrolase family 28 protein [Flavobacterium flevense]GEC72575.1 hypothetical protein FFL01_21140 [Flavobacterium flevense]SHM15756.1 Glycosyl hydrolases family 28 [Flavobacterium flevense]
MGNKLFKTRIDNSQLKRVSSLVVIGLFCFFITTSFEKNKIDNSVKKDQKITLYPAVKNLDKVKGLSESTNFDLTVDGLNAFVYHTREIADKYEHVKQLKSVSYDGVSYVNFSMTKSVTLEVSGLNGKVSNWKILPERKEFVINESKNSLTLTLNTPEKFVVTAIVNGKEQSFIISAEKPETNIPIKGDKGVLYLEPGVHQYGQAWDPFVNGIHTVYVAGGAVLEATIKANNKKNVKILGRGIISQSFVTHAEESSPNKNEREEEWDADWLGVVFIDSDNVEIDGVAITSSPSYQLEVANCKNVKINNVKLCGYGEHNNDGIHAYSTNVLVDDSFIASNDDRICITGLYDKENGSTNIQWDGSNELTGVSISNIKIKNVVFWGLDNNGADIMLTWNGKGYAKDIMVEDVVSLTATNKAFVAARHGGSADIHDLIFRNVKLLHGNLFDIEIGESNYQGEGGGKLRNMLLENITVDAKMNDIGKQLLGENKNSNIDGIKLKNIKSNDGVLTDVNQLKLKTNEFVTNLKMIK